MPESHSHLIACPNCDLRLEVPELEPGAAAVCPRCHSRIAVRFQGGWQRCAAFSMAALIALALAATGPFLIMRSAGGEVVTSYPGASFKLGLEDPVLGLFVGAVFWGVPCLVCCGLLVLALWRLRGRRDRRVRQLIRLIESVRIWCMADVFVVGTLVSLIKMMALAKIDFGYSFWATILFAILLATALASFDAKTALRELAEETKR